MRKMSMALLSALVALIGVNTCAHGSRLFEVDDVFRLRKVSEPAVSPDGRWVAYTVRETDEVSDRSIAHIWIVSWDGRQQMRLTHGATSASSPKWSPDGRFISFLATRQADGAHTQVWALDRRGGEARQLTRFAGDVEQYEWSPDASRLAVVFKEAQAPRAPGAPLVIDRYRFKSDDEGYLLGTSTRRIHLFELSSESSSALTEEAGFEESDPSWSPDGTRIAFVSNRDAEWERIDNPDVWVVAARPGSKPRRLTSFVGRDEAPLAWSPDGRRIAYAQGSAPEDWVFLRRDLAVVSVDGGAPIFPTSDFDRDALEPRFSPNGRDIEFLAIDARSVYAARVPSAGGAVRRLSENGIVIGSHSVAAAHRAVVASSDTQPSEVYALERGGLRQLTFHNAAWRAEVSLQPARNIEFASADGNIVQGLLSTPVATRDAERFPTLAWIHGGPYGQDDHEFDPLRQLFVARGYAVVQVNYRGSAGRGRQFAESKSFDQGVHDVSDVIAGIDHVIAMGVADPQRLGVGGWSYGGILTNHLIARDPRFKAAVAGAGAGNPIAHYGSDQYVSMYDHGWGAPWVNSKVWLDRSYPLFHADQIRTPTLFVGGLLDFNVPISGAEQMYQALKSLRVPTRLVIYPSEHHGISRPTLRRDLLQRYLDWYGQYLR